MTTALLEISYSLKFTSTTHGHLILNCSSHSLYLPIHIYRIAGNFRREKFSEISEKTMISENIFPNILCSYI